MPIVRWFQFVIMLRFPEGDPVPFTILLDCPLDWAAWPGKAIMALVAVKEGSIRALPV